MLDSDSSYNSDSLDNKSDASCFVDTNKDVYLDDSPKPLCENELQERAFSAKLSIINTLIFLQDIIYIKFSRVEIFPGKDDILPRAMIPENDMLMLCLETETLRLFLHNMSKVYRSCILKDSYECDDFSDTIVLSTRKICSGKWKIHITTANEQLLDESIKELLHCGLKNGYAILAGTSIACGRLVRQTKCAMEPIVLGGDMGFRISKIHHKSLFEDLLCEASPFLPRFMHSSATVTFEDIKPQNKAEFKLPTSVKDTTTIRHLSFPKREIACIIGRKGSRLTAIRETTGCNIKILPITHNIANSVTPRNIMQTMTITGTPERVYQAVNIMNELLHRYRNSTSKFI